MATARLRAELSLDNNPFVRGLRKSEEAAAATAGKLGSIFSNLATPLVALGPALAGAFTGVAIASGVKGVFDFAGGLVDVSAQTGIAIDKLVGLQRSFQDAGLQAEDVGASMNKLQGFLRKASETGDGADVLGQLGLNALQLRRLAPEEQLQAVGQAIAKVGDATERAAIARDFFGKSGGRLLAVFSDPNFGKSPEGALGKQAEILKRNAELFDSVSDRLSHAGDLFRGFYLGVGERVAGGVSVILDALDKADLVGMGQRFGDFILTGAVGFVQMLNAVKSSGFLPSMEKVGSVLKTVGQEIGRGIKDVSNLARGAVADLMKVPAVFALVDQTFTKLMGGLDEGFSGAVDFFRGKLMQAPLGMIQTALAGFNFITDTLPGKLKSGFQQAAEYLQGAFSYVAENFTADLGIRLLSSAAKFALAVASPAATAAKMLFDAGKSGGTSSLQKHLDNARGSFAGGGNDPGASLIDYMAAAGLQMGAGATKWAEEGARLEERGRKLLGGTLEKLTTTMGALPGQFTRLFQGRNPIQAGKLSSTVGAPFDVTAVDGNQPAGTGRGNAMTRAWANLSGSLATGRLSGPGSDTAETYRQNMANLRDEVKYRTPSLKGAALEDAVRAEAEKRKQAAADKAYRDRYDRTGGTMSDKAPEPKPEVILSSSAMSKLAEALAKEMKILIAL